MLKVEMLSTGDEVLHGQIVDTNGACHYLAAIRWGITLMT